MEGNGSATAGASASNGASNGVAAAAVAPAAAAPALKALIDLSETIASQPERFATGLVDAGILEQSDKALKGVFGHALESESLSLPYIGHLLRETIGVESTTTTRSSSSSSSSGSGKKRKRAPPQKHTPYHSLFPPTPLEGLVLNDVGEEAVWQQLEYRNQAVEDVLGKILVTTGAMPEEDDEDQEEDEEDELASATPASDEVDKKKRKKLAKKGGRGSEEEEIINDLSSLSDADLRAIGVDPALRAEALAAAQARRSANGSSSSDFDDDEDDDFSPDEEQEDEGMFPDGYPGASDYSSDEEDEEGGGGAGSSKRVYYEPLRTEREQRRKKEEDERREMQRVRMLSGLRGGAGMMGEDDSEEEEDDEDDDYGLEDDSEEEEEDDDEEEEEDAATASFKRPVKRSILDSLDDDASGSSSTAPGSSNNGRRHPTLDDDFFSIDEFNRQTEEQERREIFKEAANGDKEEDEEDVDMFQAFSDDDDAEDEDGDAAMAGAGGAADLRYADFFEPPPNRSGPSQRGGAQKRAKGKGKGSRVGQGAKLAKQERDAHAAEEEESDEDAGAEGVDDFEALGLDKADDDSSDDGEDETQPARPNTRVRFAPQVAIRNIKARPNKGLEDGELGEITPELLKALQEQDGDAGSDESGSDDDEDDSEDDGMSENGSDDDDDDEEEDSDTADASEDGQSVNFDEQAEQETARRFAGDLFADNSDDDDDAPRDANGSSSSSSTARISAHERRLTSLQAEIARLESENVAAKDWTLSGEASSRARPKDSLLEQDLEFEQTSRPTPTITIDKTEALEELIKRRILENRFDDVVARRVFAQPEYKPEAELSDRKSGKSLAEEYEEDLRRKDSGAEAPRSETERKLDAERTAIAGLMDDLFDKLDALSNAHFTPRAPKAAITTLSSSAPAIAMEGAATTLPGTAHLPSQLAAHEVLERGEVEKVMRGAGGELSHEEKQALHRRKKRAAGAKRDADEVAKGVKAMNDGAGKKVASGSGSAEQKPGGGDKKEKKGPSAQQKEKDEAMKKLLGMRGVTVVGKGSGKGEKKGGGSAAGGGKGKEVERRGEGFKL